jgi:hypothetical protein
MDYKFFLEGPERERPLRIFRHRCEDNTELYDKKTGLESVDQMHVAQEK